jgi:hypothetical protein
MANCDTLFKKFNGKDYLEITKAKRDNLKTSRKALRKKIREYFAEQHPKYKPKFTTQGSFKMFTVIRTKDDTCDLDDGVYFKSNPDNVSCKTLQQWVKNAVEGTTDATPVHKVKCITVDYKAGYNIDLPVFVFDQNIDAHPYLAIKDKDFRLDDPKEFYDEFNKCKDEDDQLTRIVRYLKAWCDYKREKMPSGFALTILAMNNLQTNERDDISLKYTLIQIENELKYKWECKVPTTPNDDLFENYDEARKNNFLNNLSEFIEDAKKAVDEEKNQFKASKCWKRHLGDRFPEGEDVDEKPINTALLSGTIGTAKPYFGN